MTVLKYAAATSVAIALVLGAVAAALPYSASALNAPNCVFNTIVQPFNNGGTTLSWKVYNASLVQISGIGTVSDADSIVVYPSEVTDYTLTATGSGGTDSCTVTVLPTSAYPNAGRPYPHFDTDYKCEINVAPDFVVPGGTAVLSWNAGDAWKVNIDRGVGTVGRTGSRVIPNTGTPQTFQLTAEWTDGTTRTCSATVRPGNVIVPPTFGGGVNIPPTYPPVSRYSGVTPFPTPPSGTAAPYQTLTPPAGGIPQVTATYTPPKPQYVPLNSVPYTGPNDAAYVLTLLAIALGAFTILYTQRSNIASTLASFSPTDDDDAFETAVEQAVVREA
ncbi:hypothetical protein CL652_00200 [bacterium]|nr:hypothetical protein [bacterium]|tara:strand:- start:4321 stop:5316 length:996 start_codon:yes stop_codon:yes gene_type:complete